MMATNKPKYIAEGFHEDVGNLISEFTEKSTTQFSEFSAIWRKHHFSLIFMGRPDETELTEFTNEIYRITCQFFSSPSFYQQVGAVYTLYALFLNQISNPTIKIRIEMSHWRTIKALLIEAVAKEYKTLHYVIDYLIKNAFIYVASQTLKGPLTGSMRTAPKNHEIVSTMNTQYKKDITQYSISNNLSTLKDLHTQYYNEKKNISDLVKIHLNPAHEVYDKFIRDLNDLVHPETTAAESSSYNVGDRRAKLKAASFQTVTKDRFGELNDEPNSENDANNAVCDPKGKGITRRRRVPKHERKVGRPRKHPQPENPEPEESSDNEEIDISHLLSQQQDFYLPPAEDENRKARIRRDFYYKVSPKREENDSSDPDDK